MRNAAKASLLLLGCAIFAGAVLSLLGPRLWRAGREELKGLATEATQAGRRHAQTNDDAGCLAEALARYRACDDLRCRVAHNLFLRACLRACAPTEAFCREVPPESDLVASIRWRLAECERHDVWTGHCNDLFATVQAMCAERTAG